MAATTINMTKWLKRGPVTQAKTTPDCPFIGAEGQSQSIVALGTSYAFIPDGTKLGKRLFAV